MSWADSLIKLASYEVENRQARLAAVTRRRQDAETRLAVLTAEGEAEEKHAASNAESGWYLAGYSEGLKVRKAAIQAEIDAIEAEERGARDALAEAAAGRATQARSYQGASGHLFVWGAVWAIGNAAGQFSDRLGSTAWMVLTLVGVVASTLIGRRQMGVGASARPGDPGLGARARAHEVLVDGHVAGLFECRQMGAKVAVGGLGDRLQALELEPLALRKGVQDRHQLQPRRLVDDLVSLGHAQTRRNQRPPRISPPPPTTALHRKNQSRRNTQPTITPTITAAPMAARRRPALAPMAM